METRQAIKQKTDAVEYIEFKGFGNLISLVFTLGALVYPFVDILLTGNLSILGTLPRFLKWLGIWLMSGGEAYCLLSVVRAAFTDFKNIGWNRFLIVFELVLGGLMFIFGILFWFRMIG